MGQIDHRREVERHQDFQRILDEFVKYYGSKSKGESEYNTWIDELSLDETKPYGYGFESFSFAKDKISLWKEDEENKYYKVLVGFPLKSMNGNVYMADELKAAAKTLIGVTPNLNHWADVKLTGSKFVESAYEDGAVESVLKVPKALICPECGKEKKFYEYIDEKHIVNVSLECSCSKKGVDGSCGGMEFTGCALLTKDTLPGIPLARIFPLEAIMSEALKRGHHKERKKMVVEVVGLSGEAQLDPGDPNKPLDKNPIKPDGHFQCPEGMIYSPTQGKCVESKTCPEGQVWDEALGKCMPIEKAPPEGTDVQTGTQAAGDTSHQPIEADFNPVADWPDSCFAYVPSSAKGANGNKSDRKLPYKWPDGRADLPHVRNALARLDQTQGIPAAEKEKIRKMLQDILAKANPGYTAPQDYTPPSEELIKAQREVQLNNAIVETNRMRLELQGTHDALDDWKKQFSEVNAEKLQLEGKYSELDKQYRKEKEQKDALLEELRKENLELSRRHDVDQRRIIDLTEDKNQMEKRLDAAMAHDSETAKKNDEFTRVNLEVTKNLSTANEEIVKLTNVNRELEEKIRKTKRLGKVIVQT